MNTPSMDHPVNINLFGTVHFNKAVLAQMMKQNERGLEAPKGGYTIVNIGSKGAVAGLPSAPSYTAVGLVECTELDVDVCR